MDVTSYMASFVHPLNGSMNWIQPVKGAFYRYMLIK